MITKTEKEIMKHWGVYGKPIVTVICPVYNHRKYIGLAMDGILMQETDFPFEINVHDDASTDGTQEILQEYKNKYPNIINLTLEEKNVYSQGMDKFLEVRFGNVRGEYAICCEGDDYWIDKEKLQLLVDFLRENDDYMAVYHPTYYIRKNKIVGNDVAYDKDTDVNAADVIEKGGGFISTSAFMFRTEILEGENDYIKIAGVGDYVRQINAIDKGGVRYINKIMGCYRIGDSGSWSMMNQRKTDQAEGRNRIIRYLLKFDDDTNAKYRNSIYYRIGMMADEILYYGGAPIMAWDDILKNVAPANRDRLEKLGKIRKWKQHCPTLYRVYYLIKYKLLNGVLKDIFGRKAPVPA